MAERPLTVEAAAEHLGCSPSHVRNLCARGELRHFRIGRLIRIPAAVHMVESGVPIVEVAQYLGHSSESVTYRVYARFSPTYLRRAAGALE